MMTLYSTCHTQKIGFARSRGWFSQLTKTSFLTSALWGLRPISTTNAFLPRTDKPSVTESTCTPRTFALSCRGGALRPRFASSALLLATAKTREEEEMTKHAMEIVHNAIQAVDPTQAVRSHFKLHRETSTLEIGGDEQAVEGRKELTLSDYDELVLVAFGKASSAMATAVLKELIVADETLAFPKSSGVVICKDDHCTKEEMDLLSRYGINVQMASHPVPDERSAEAASNLLAMVQEHASPKTLVICCISGGGSALFCKPAEPLTLQDLQKVNSVLLGSGMGIQEMNVIRKRLEDGKGGRLAEKSSPSQLVTLVLSDVLGDPLDLIASGPTVPDTSTWQDAWDIVQQYQLQELLPQAVLRHLEQGTKGELMDSPSAEHPIFETSSTVLVGNNALAVDAAAKKAKDLGYHAVILGNRVEGEAREIPNVYMAMAMYLQEQEQAAFMSEPNCSRNVGVAPSLPVALIAGGETTVSLTSTSGKGGRNQELALSAALLLQSMGLRNVVLASVGTDGTDGPTDAAGAVVDGTTVSGDLHAARTALSQHNAYPYLDNLGRDMLENDLPPPLIRTGPTGTNVADVCVTLVSPKK